MSVLKAVVQLCCVVLVFVLVSTHVEAATIPAMSCARSAVVTAINAAAPGDTVSVPAESCSWSSAISLPANKDLTLLGAGINQTVLTCSDPSVNPAAAAVCFLVPLSVTTRISGFTFQESEVRYQGPVAAGKTFRLDHNKFSAATVWRVIDILGGAPARHPMGLIDHNDFHNYGVHVNGTDQSLDDGPEQHQLWAQAPPLGSGTSVVYIENNAFVGTLHQNAVDGNYGGRFTFRFNTLSGMTYAEVHSVQGRNRAVQLWEFYGNTYSKTTEDFYPLALVRGGTGVIFGNQLSAIYTNDILVDNVRSCRDPGKPGENVGKCDGSSNWDQNRSGMMGYACRDQVGRGRDSTVWAEGSPYAQTAMPAYFWGNIKGASTPLSVAVSGEECTGAGGDLNTTHIAANRDFYNDNPSFTGATGVGMGTLAARPPMCTTGVAYWATDQGEWNSTNSIPDGQLYKCTATDTWSLDHKPFVYPHPLTSLIGTPSAPSNLRIIH